MPTHMSVFNHQIITHEVVHDPIILVLLSSDYQVLLINMCFHSFIYSLMGSLAILSVWKVSVFGTGCKDSRKRSSTLSEKLELLVQSAEDESKEIRVLYR